MYSYSDILRARALPCSADHINGCRVLLGSGFEAGDVVAVDQCDGYWTIYVIGGPDDDGNRADVLLYRLRRPAFTLRGRAAREARCASAQSWAFGIRHRIYVF